jgi:hypothetical protein
MNSKKKRTKKTTGISRRLWLSLLAGVFPLAAQGGYAVIAGTVFRESGHAFAGAELELQPDKPGKKNKKQLFRTNSRGEYAFRVPAEPMEYALSLKIDGYRPESKRVKIVGDERVEHNFLLERATKEK